MSYILDALKKSERQRRSSRELVFHTDARRPGASYAVRALAMLAALTAVGAVLGAALLYRENPPKATDAAASAATPQASPANGSFEPARDSAALDAPPQSASASAAAGHAEVHDLAEQAVTEQSASSAKPAGGAQNLRTPARRANAQGVPFLQEMPADFQKQLPPLTVNIHVYARDESERILYINNRQYRRGDTLQDGIVVEDIVPDGVVLRYHGQLFKLPRPR